MSFSLPESTLILEKVSFGPICVQGTWIDWLIKYSLLCLLYQEWQVCDRHPGQKPME